jgi:hypothetical protein
LEEVKGSSHPGANFLSFHRDLMVAAHERLLDLGLDVSDHHNPRVVPVPVVRHPKTQVEVRLWEAELSFRIDQYMLCFAVTGVGIHVVSLAVAHEDLVEVLSGYISGYPVEVSRETVAGWVTRSNLEVLALACALWLLEPVGPMASSAADLDAACFERMLYAFELNPLIRSYIIARDNKQAEADRLTATNAMAGWSAANLSLAGDAGKELNPVLGGVEVPKKVRYERLYRELPSATLIAWSAREAEESLSSSRPTGRPEKGGKKLTRRVVKEIREALGNEADIRSVEILHEAFGVDAQEDDGRSEERFGEADELLKEFELWETAQEWVVQAKLSEQEELVLELDLRFNGDTGRIARELGKSEGHVRVVRKNYRDKIYEVRKAAGL